jgi:hypothetical protein
MSESSEGKKSESRAGSIMDDSRRILRYVMPGLVFAVQAGIFIYIVYPEKVWEQVETSGKDGLGAALASVLVSGALGYICATLHHGWVRLCQHERLPWHDVGSNILDHSAFVRKLIKLGLYPARSDSTGLTRLDADSLAWKDWYCRVEDGTIAKAVEAKVESLSDQAHGFGAARVAAVFGTVVAGWYCFIYPNVIVDPCDNQFGFRAVAAVAFSLAAVVSLWLAYRRLGAYAQTVFELALEEAVVKDRELPPPY